MTVLGCMSGTSLDGLDLALCEFGASDNGYAFKILKAETIGYSGDWKTRLTHAKNNSAEQYFELHARYGNYIANEINFFLKGVNQPPQLIASHGHTVFHQPHLGFSTQIGCGATIAAATGITTACDFRSLDVANGGQGAPLVPIGDAVLFKDYDACLNIGGIANISFDKNGKRVAYDICEANMLLNYLAEKMGQAFDRAGAMAGSGAINAELLSALNNLAYYSQTGAKSIGREWFESTVLTLVEKDGSAIKDLLATCTEHVAQTIANELTAQHLKTVLITGGGAFNDFLLERIKVKTTCEVILPSTEIINFKEALIFAFLGYLRIHETTNTWRSVTGAKTNSVGGAVYVVNQNP